MKKIILFILLSPVCLNAYSQENNQVEINFGVALKNNPIALHDSTYLVTDGVSLKFKTLKFYVSGIQLLLDGKPVFIEPNSYHLIDVSSPASQIVYLRLKPEIKFNKLTFNLGIDSTTNVSGAMGGDLDPTNGMYWTWQSGYINFKLEGSCPTCLPSKKGWELHLGGYQNPFNPLQKIEIQTVGKRRLHVVLRLDDFFQSPQLSFHQNIMSPCENAVILSRELSKHFTLK